MPGVYVRRSGSWTPLAPYRYRYQQGSWVRPSVYRRVNGQWVLIASGAVVRAEAATLTDAVQVSSGATKAGADTGTGTERIAGATRTAADAGAGTESASAAEAGTVQRFASDTGTGADDHVVNGVSGRSGADTGTGTDAFALLSPDKFGADVAAGTETPPANEFTTFPTDFTSGIGGWLPFPSGIVLTHDAAQGHAAAGSMKLTHGAVDSSEAYVDPTGGWLTKGPKVLRLWAKADTPRRVWVSAYAGGWAQFVNGSAVVGTGWTEVVLPCDVIYPGAVNTVYIEQTTEGGATQGTSIWIDDITVTPQTVSAARAQADSGTGTDGHVLDNGQTVDKSGSDSGTGLEGAHAGLAPRWGPGYVTSFQVPETNEFMGPICDTNGWLWTVQETGSGSSLAMLVRSYDGGVTWNEIDAANKPSTNDMEAIFLLQDNQETGHVWVLQQDSSDDVTLHSFHTSDHATLPSRWSTSDVVVESAVGSIPPNNQCVQLVQRSNGDLFCFWAGDGELVSAVNRSRIHYRRRAAAGTWDAEVILDAGTTNSMGQVAVVLGANDKIHIFGEEDARKEVWHRSLSSGGVLSAWERADGVYGTETIDHPMTNATYHNVGGVERVWIGWITGAQQFRVNHVDDDATPATPQLVTGTAVDNGALGSGSVNAYIRTHGNVLYAVYVDESTKDLWRTQSDNLATFATPVELWDAITGQWVQTNVYTRRNKVRLGILVEIGGIDQYSADLHYLEHNLT